ncbi:MAG: hypothetical protein Q8Q09_04900 [Deltaproteobacteria bacterium]|nr:hypothetical protein [Deltaproteobacteria bacterium]
MATSSKPKKASKPAKSPKVVTAPKPARGAELDRDAMTKLRGDWKIAHSKLRALVKSGAKTFDQRYELAAEMMDHEPPLYLAAGITSFAAFCAQVLEEDERVARRNVRVARHATEADVQRLGVHKIDAALSYLDAKGTKSVTKGLRRTDFDALRIALEMDGKKRLLPLAEVSIKQITDAANLKNRGATRRLASDPLLVQLDKAISKRPLVGVRVRKSQGKISFVGLTRESLAEFAKAIAEVDRTFEAAMSKKPSKASQASKAGKAGKAGKSS